MINLLPPETKEELMLEKKKKLFIILGITMLIPLACLILILSSVLLFILGEVSSQKIVLEEAKKQYQTPDFLNFKDIIQRDNKNLIQIQSFYTKEIYFSNILHIIASMVLPKNFYITDLFLDKDQSQNIKVTARGFSKTRDDLLLFQKNLQVNQQITNPYFSPASWIDPQDVTFNVTFGIKK